MSDRLSLIYVQVLRWDAFVAVIKIVSPDASVLYILYR